MAIELKEKKILIVEDDPPLLSILKETFTAEGFTVFVAQDGEEGLAVAKKIQPDLVLIDILLPKLDGITMASEIKEAGIDTKMIFLTNLSDVGNITKASAVAFTDYLVKSDWKIDDVVDRVKSKLGVK